MHRESFKQLITRKAKGLAKRGMRRVMLAWEMPRAYARAAREKASPQKVAFVYATGAEHGDAFSVVMTHLEKRYDLNVRVFSLARQGSSVGERRRQLLEIAKGLATASTVFLDKPSPEIDCLPIRPETRVIAMPNGLRDCDGRATERILSMLEADFERFPKPPVAERMHARNPDGIDLSIVIPAYNASSTLERAIDSVVSQTYDLNRIELVIVDDCSSDETQAIAQHRANKYPGLIRLASRPYQSGSPAAPRNQGLSMARGEYVFFLDADDWLEPEAAERMLAHALDWNSDVLLVKLVGEGGRKAPRAMFKFSQPKADIYRSKVMWTLGPVKLYRRSLIENLRFPETFMPEDVSFVLRAYLTANIVSVAADYDYCHIALTGNSTDNVSLGIWKDIDSNLLACEDIFGLIGEKMPEGKRSAVLRRLLRQDICYMLHTIGLESNIHKAQMQLSRLMKIVGPFVDLNDLGEATKEERALLEAAFGESL